MTKEPTIKILVGYHKPAVLLQSEILTPIHLGRALATEASKDGQMSKADYQWMLDNMIGDDTGDNISKENRQINELSAHYWAWKNSNKLDNPDYIGFCHYRRYFILEDQNYQNLNKQFPFDNIYEIKDKLECNFDFKKYDCLAPYKENVQKRGYSSILDQFAKSKGHVKEDLIKTIAYIKKEYPQFATLVDEYFQGAEGYFYNMFVMKKELFNQYAKFTFNIKSFLLTFVDNTRRAAFVLERITGFYLYLLSKSYKTKELPVAYIQCTDKLDQVLPVFSKNAIPIVFCSDNNYIPNTSVAIKSIISNANSNNNLDIIIIGKNISNMHKNIIYRMQKNNVSIRIYDVPDLCDKEFYVHKHFSVTTYYRFFLGEIFKKYSKLIYLDGDIIVNQDISSLYSLNLNEYVLGAVRALGAQCAYFKDNLLKNNMRMQEYWDQVLKIKDVYKYFNAGMLLINVDEFNNQNILPKLFKGLKEIKKPVGVDQDILNYVCQDKVKILPNKYNFIQQNEKEIMQFLPTDIYNEYKKAENNFVILHYVDSIKPWNDFSRPRAMLWWQYARQTPFYEICLYKNFVSKFSISLPTSTSETLKVSSNLTRTVLKYLWYKILKEITYGKVKKQFQEKYRKYKNILINNKG